MIHGVGVDLVQVERIQLAITRHGERFARRLLSDMEFRNYQEVTRKAPYLAKRFAAKEAFLKALGTGLRAGLTWQGIAVSHTSLGQPQLELNGAVSKLMQEIGISTSHLSISDDGAYAVACVTLERN